MSVLYNKKYPMQAKAKWQIQKRVQRGQINKPKTCQMCGKKYPRNKLHGHHYTYENPSVVLWCCQSCHTEIHKIKDYKKLQWHVFCEDMKIYEFFNENNISGKCGCKCECCGFNYLADDGSFLSLKNGKPIQDNKTPLCGVW